MIGIINKLYANNSRKMERHQIYYILGTNLYNEAKAIVHEKIDTSDILPEKLKVIARNLHHDGELSQEELQITSRIEF